MIRWLPFLFMTPFFVGLSLPAEARWAPSERPLAFVGAIATSCRGEFCMVLACPRGEPTLFSMAPGGGPFEGAARATVGGQAFALQFVEDSRFMNRFGILGTVARLPAGGQVRCRLAANS
jgi:hypothetical protein